MESFPKYGIIFFILAPVLLWLWRRYQAWNFHRTLTARNWKQLPHSPVQEPWAGKNYGSITCYQAKLHSGITCVILKARHLRETISSYGRRYTIDPYLAIYLPPPIKLNPKVVAVYQERLQKLRFTETLRQVHQPTEGGLVLAWHSQPSIKFLDTRLREVAQTFLK